MPVRLPSIGSDLIHSNGSVIGGNAFTADFDSEWMDMQDCDVFGIWLDVTISTGTLDYDFECTFDDGTTVYTAAPSIVNSQTANTMTQVSATGQSVKFFFNVLPSAGKAGKMRLEFTITGTVTINQAIITKANRSVSA